MSTVDSNVFTQTSLPGSVMVGSCWASSLQVLNPTMLMRLWCRLHKHMRRNATPLTLQGATPCTPGCILISQLYT